MSDQANIRRQAELQAGQLGAPYGLAAAAVGHDATYRQNAEPLRGPLYATAPPNHEALIAAAVNALNKAVADAKRALWTVDVTINQPQPGDAASGPHRLVRVSMNREI